MEYGSKKYFWVKMYRGKVTDKTSQNFTTKKHLDKKWKIIFPVPKLQTKCHLKNTPQNRPSYSWQIVHSLPPTS